MKLDMRIVFKVCPACHKSTDFEEEGDGWVCNECGNTFYSNLDIEIRPSTPTAKGVSE